MVYYACQIWHDDGTLQRVQDALREQVRLHEGREPISGALILHSKKQIWLYGVLVFIKDVTPAGFKQGCELPVRSAMILLRKEAGYQRAGSTGAVGAATGPRQKLGRSLLYFVNLERPKLQGVRNVKEAVRRFSASLPYRRW